MGTLMTMVDTFIEHLTDHKAACGACLDDMLCYQIPGIIKGWQDELAKTRGVDARIDGQWTHQPLSAEVAREEAMTHILSHCDWGCRDSYPFGVCSWGQHLQDRYELAQKLDLTLRLWKIRENDLLIAQQQRYLATITDIEARAKTPSRSMAADIDYVTANIEALYTANAKLRA